MLAPEVEGTGLPSTELLPYTKIQTKWEFKSKRKHERRHARWGTYMTQKEGQRSRGNEKTWIIMKNKYKDINITKKMLESRQGQMTMIQYEVR